MQCFKTLPNKNNTTYYLRKPISSQFQLTAANLEWHYEHFQLHSKCLLLLLHENAFIVKHMQDVFRCSMLTHQN